MRSRPLFVYHSPCFDGFTSAWVADLKRRTADPNDPRDYDFEFHPAKYGDPPPDARGRNVLIFDFSYPRDQMEKLLHDSTLLVVRDHHVSAARDLQSFHSEHYENPNLDFEFDLDRSGAGLAWEYFFPDEPPPRLVQLVEDRDLWRFSFGEDTRRFHAVLSSSDMSFDTWDSLHARLSQEDGVEASDIMLEGAAICRNIDMYCSRIADQARIVRWGPAPLSFSVRPSKISRENTPNGFTVVIANAPYMNSSELGHLLLERQPKADFSATWFQRRDGWAQFSLRSRDDGPDVSTVAKWFDGGGHRHAAGFRTTLHQALNLIDPLG